MAVVEHEYPTTGFADNRRVQGGDTTALTNTTYFNTVASMRTVLNAANSTYYTTARLNEMTRNDMVYACRVIAEAAGI